MDFLTALKNGVLLADGGMGTLLAAHLGPGEPPYLLNMTAPDVVLTAHKAYTAAGADIITANTFTAANDELVRAGVALVKQAEARFTALDLGPTGYLMEPMGELSFEAAYEHFTKLALAGADSGADLVLIETMSDLYECKAAILAIKENTSLPVICTLSLQENGRTLTGCNIKTAAAILESLGVDALGLNCSLGPAQLRPFVLELLETANVPVAVQPNAGLPRVTDGGDTVYDVSPEAFSEYAAGFARAGARIVGGCCGTTPAHIAGMRKLLDEAAKPPLTVKKECPHIIAASGTRAASLSGGPLLIGERLNPTGRKRLRQALREGDMEEVRREALAQQEAGCHILDVNAGLPDIDEPAVLAQMVRAVQSVSNLPVQIDSTDLKALEAALRVVNGKAVVNSVNGKRESLDSVLPLAKKYGAAVIGLTLDENGIPGTAEQRLAIARRIRGAAVSHGIPEKDLLIDCLTLTVAAQPDQVPETLRAVRLVKEELGLATVLGVSNVSYGMPERENLGAAFLIAALASGLDAAILNPLSEPFAGTIRSWRVLSGRPEASAAAGTEDKPLQWVIEQYDKGTVFLPELLLAARKEIERLKLAAPSQDAETRQDAASPPILLASVQGDIHDIGKSIVQAMLECHGFNVVDLGKDVPSGRVVEAVREYGAKLVGLSALMTTTVGNMRRTIIDVLAAAPDCAVMIGGAAADASVSDAAYYGRDAMEAVAIARRVYGREG
ncbi:MAG: homocysteine S-methyltransferase family protein [Oscillospiraceae bacterium]|jgi:5-methyltetrahydrofolate--homocysteine methyltransferase|nr:homocysteine S-methyltransferase family protein [Oscillospiraceae bacterium]